MIHLSRIKVSLIALAMIACSITISAKDSSALNILLTNDDGYGAAGIVAVQTALADAGHTVYVVAPADNQSGKGTGINTDNGAVVALTEMVPGKEWKMAGTPTDSVNVALDVALAGVGIDLVVSGANAGDNVGIIANNSGTVSAAMRAVRRGYPAIAISVATDLYNLYRGYKAYEAGDYQGGAYLIQLAEQNQLNAMDDAAALVVSIIAQLECTAAFPWNQGKLMPDNIGLNVNIPAKETADFTGVLFTKSDNASIVDLTFEAGDAPGEVKVTADIDRTLLGVLFGQVPADVLNLESEGEAIIGGYATISPMDGNWSSIGNFFAGSSMRLRLRNILK